MDGLFVGKYLLISGIAKALYASTGLSTYLMPCQLMNHSVAHPSGQLLGNVQKALPLSYFLFA